MKNEEEKVSYKTFLYHNDGITINPVIESLWEEVLQMSKKASVITRNINDNHLEFDQKLANKVFPEAVYLLNNCKNANELNIKPTALILYGAKKYAPQKKKQ